MTSTADDIAISVRNLTKTYRPFWLPGGRIEKCLGLADAPWQERRRPNGTPTWEST